MKFLPFESDLEYLSAELTWIRARANRLAAGLEMHGDCADGDEPDGEAVRPEVPEYLGQLCRGPGNETLKPRLEEIERQHRLAIEIAIGESRTDGARRRGNPHRPRNPVTSYDLAVGRAQYRRRRAIEEAVREHVDGRVAETCRQGKELALLRLCRDHDLHDLERTILLLAAY